MVAQAAVDGSARVGSLVKSAGQPYAGKPHVRLEEGAPVGRPWRDTQALPTERGSNSYGPSYSSARPGPTLHSPEGLVDPGASQALAREQVDNTSVRVQIGLIVIRIEDGQLVVLGDDGHPVRAGEPHERLVEPIGG